MSQVTESKVKWNKSCREDGAIQPGEESGMWKAMVRFRSHVADSMPPELLQRAEPRRRTVVGKAVPPTATAVVPVALRSFRSLPAHLPACPGGDAPTHGGDPSRC